MYNKLFSSILNSSIWSEDSDTCKVWITLLAMADKHGNVFASPLGVARIASLSVEVINEALGKFMSPDPLSMDIARGGDGRRISPLDQGGWHLTNFGYYDSIGKAIQRQEDNAAAAQRYRDKHKMTVIERQHTSSPVTDRQPSEAEAYSEAEAKAKERGRGAFAPPTLSDVQAWVSEKGYHFDPGAFVAYYEEREWKRNDGKKLRDWHLACVTWESREEKVSTSRKSLESALGQTAPPAAQNPHGLRSSKDGASICYNGQWFHPHPDGKRWLTEEECRPDGRHISYEAGNPELNNEVYAAMNKLAGRA